MRVSEPSADAEVEAVARAFRWPRMLDTGVHATLNDLAKAKGVAPSHVSRVLRLTLLAPEIGEAILDGWQPDEMRLENLLEGIPAAWDEHAISAAARTRRRPAAELAATITNSARQDRPRRCSVTNDRG